ncbi:tol-pal system-associated acyl-CoA thioesterase [Rhodoferax sp. OV413]|uniref:tol-pal system-associated acyl-CoA thioesterase n=1 Tax=Rhodoferax sp. OV413 TaxID=1855285 RepID=UPI0025F5F302|nr:tol-pal system-associated acyl-CoA thioesterase [Rhodoferax sp. OV413]
MKEFLFPVRVYWEDTDAGGVVFYANYLKFFERARTEWLRASGIEQQTLREEAGVMFMVAEAQTRYVSPARLDDLLQISVQVQEQGAASMLIQQEARRGDTLLAEGRIRIACVQAATFKPCRIPAAVLRAVKR